MGSPSRRMRVAANGCFTPASTPSGVSAPSSTNVASAAARETVFVFAARRVAVVMVVVVVAEMEVPHIDVLLRYI